jgi:hypothetical protein
LHGPQRGDTILKRDAPGTLHVVLALQAVLLFSGDFMRSCVLWLIGVPIPIIIILWLLTGHA